MVILDLHYLMMMMTITIIPSPLAHFSFCVHSASFAASVHTYNHQSTQTPLTVLFLPVSGWMMAVTLLYMFYASVGKLKFSHVLRDFIFSSL